ncbi:patatin-like phospholipase family protein [Xanthomarina sp. F2636L]|uniref:patatin-like phospholipase family protein n=1 Tax=Xanthomarina sp. F2636L TaxID=2996018 RepID=UPI00225E69FB|nr:patatin-like phospholipase family protein [Xanthomarina sp. F2636L]MCX7549400.1 patatin-like phospholipase family protein [Xanthomarina sp. F2636L]
MLPLSLFAQDDIQPQVNKKPKVALVLSGGGAKGIAHIPVLQALDSLGIVPDLIVGTSMGAVVGGMYAMGYTGDSIAKIASQAKWGELLGGDVSLKDVGVEEKSEFGRYLVNLDYINGKPKIKASLLKDQNLREFLSTVMYPVYNVTDFDDLAIPFRAVTTDLVNGHAVVIKEGSLAQAIRASMSIPSVFQPVPYNETLLVDGGVVDNFPTGIAKELGADIIIGSNVGGGLQPKEKLDNIATILFQMSMLTSNLKDPANKALCDILIDHVGNLSYSTQDFEKSDAIYKQGLIAKSASIDSLAILAKQLNTYKQREHALPEMKNNIVFDSIQYHNISKENLNLLKARMQVFAHKRYDINELLAATDRAMGTELFYQINYHVEVVEGKNILHLNAVEKAKNQISGALHYDTQQGVGLVVNYTGRNILGYYSRLLIGLDIAEQPKFRIQYQQNVGDTKSWWWRAETFGQRVKQNFYLQGNKGEELKNSYFQMYGQINKNLSSIYNYIGLDLIYSYTKLKPSVDPSFNDNVYDLRKYTYGNLEVNLQFQHNSMNQVFFATSGTYFNTRIGRTLASKVEVSLDVNSQNDVEGITNGFSKFSFLFEKRMPITEKTSLITGLSTGFMFMDDVDANDISVLEYGPTAKYFLGGNLVRPIRDAIVFQGLKDSELIASQYMKLHIATQFNPLNNIYLTPYVNLASVGFGDFDDYMTDAFSPKGNWVNTTDTSLLFSAGTTISYNSILGPVNFDMAYINDLNKVKLFFSVGLKLSIPY